MDEHTDEQRIHAGGSFQAAVSVRSEIPEDSIWHLRRPRLSNPPVSPAWATRSIDSPFPVRSAEVGRAPDHIGKRNVSEQIANSVFWIDFAITVPHRFEIVGQLNDSSVFLRSVTAAQILIGDAYITDAAYYREGLLPPGEYQVEAASNRDLVINDPDPPASFAADYGLTFQLMAVPEPLLAWPLIISGAFWILRRISQLRPMI